MERAEDDQRSVENDARESQRRIWQDIIRVVVRQNGRDQRGY